MWKYGKRIIDNLIKKRTKCTPVCAELESRREADSDRSDIGMFEVGLSAEQYGNYEQGSGDAAQEKEGNRLIAIANLYFIDPIIMMKKPAVKVLEYYYGLLK